MPFKHLIIIQGDMPHLRDLTIGLSDLPDDDEPTRLELFDRAPQLTTVVLAECFVPSVMCLPWSQLTFLVGLCLYEHECADILRHATNLVRYTMTVCSPPEPNILAVPAHSHLRNLVIIVKDSADVDLSNVLNALTLPMLRTLEVPELYVSMVDPLATLKDFVSRSRCTLDELLVTGPSALSVPEYREALPTVRRIVLDG
jgi:hypothetical protein